MLCLQLSTPPCAARRAYAALPRLAAARSLARPLTPAARALSAKPVDIDPSLLGDMSLSGAAGDGVPVGTPRPGWNKYGYATRCASVVKASTAASEATSDASTAA